MRPFIDTLEKMLQAHEQLLNLAREKQEVLIKGDVQELNKLLKEESTLVKQIGKLEALRQRQAQGLAARHRVNADEELTLEKLLAAIPDAGDDSTGENGKQQVLDLAQRLRDVIGRIKEQNELNMRLTEDALQLVNYSLELLTQTDEEITYHKPNNAGQQAPAAGRGFFDAQA